MNALWRPLRYVRDHIPTLVAVYGCMIVLAIANACYAALCGPALSFVFRGDLRDVLHDRDGMLRNTWRWLPKSWLQGLDTLPADAGVWIIPVALIITAIVKGMAQTGQFALLGRLSQHILRTLRQQTFTALLRLSPSFYHKRSHGDLLSRLTHDAHLIEQAMFYGYAPILRDTLIVIALLGYCFITDAKLALMTLITVPLSILPLSRFAQWLKRVSRQSNQAQADFNAVAYEALAGHRLVQAYGTEAYEIGKIARVGQRYFHQMCVSYFIRAIRTPVMEILGAIALAGLLAYLGQRVRMHGDDPAHYISFFFAMIMMYEPLKNLGRVSDYLAAGTAAAERIFELIDTRPDIQDKPNARTLLPFSKQVVFHDVSFSYDTIPVLERINLTLQMGELVAIVGPSGAGKTTLAHLLPRFYDVTAGMIEVDGHDIRDVTLASLRSQMAVVSQDTFLFNTSVAENIRYGSPQATDAAIRQAARAAYAEEFITRLPQGYDTVIGERGVILSGGQRQRLAIARALLRNTPLLILDEATSALDIDSERYVQQALETLMQGRTSLVIAHRLSTVRRADRIVVLRHGRIIESGDHNTLMQQQGEYARLYHLQFSE